MVGPEAGWLLQLPLLRMLLRAGRRRATDSCLTPALVVLLPVPPRAHPPPSRSISSPSSTHPPPTPSPQPPWACRYWGQAGKTRYIQENKIKLRDLFEEAPEDEDYGKGGTPSKSAAAWAAIFRHSVASVQSSHSGGSGPPRLHHGLQRLQLAGTKLPVARVPGIGIYFNELLTGVPPVLVSVLSRHPRSVVFIPSRLLWSWHDRQ